MPGGAEYPPGSGWKAPGYPEAVPGGSSGPYPGGSGGGSPESHRQPIIPKENLKNLLPVKKIFVNSNPIDYAKETFIRKIPSHPFVPENNEKRFILPIFFIK